MLYQYFTVKLMLKLVSVLHLNIIIIISIFLTTLYLSLNTVGGSSDKIKVDYIVLNYQIGRQILFKQFLK